MSYQRTIEWLYALEARAGMDFRLERLYGVLDRLGNPQLEFPAVHLVGTNGKGSTAAMLHSVYHTAGYRVGLYTSPHLVSFRERIVVGGRRIERDAVVRHVEEIRRAADAANVSLTFFEIATLTALLEFRDARVDLAVVEAGLGGRLDATNVVQSVATVLTSVGRDHEAYLGDRIEGIAAEKVAVVREKGTLVSGPLPVEALAVVRERVRRTGAVWLHYGRDFGPSEAVRPGGAGPGLRGAHQRRNAGVATAVVGALADRFPVAAEVRDRALANTRWPGRLEVFEGQPRVIADAAHNPQAAACLREALSPLLASGKVVLLFGVMADKDWREMLCTLVPICDHVVLAPVAVGRSLDPRQALEVAAGLRMTTVALSAGEGLDAAIAAAGRDGTVVVTGSIFLVGELYPRLCGHGGRGVAGG